MPKNDVVAVVQAESKVVPVPCCSSGVRNDVCSAAGIQRSVIWHSEVNPLVMLAVPRSACTRKSRIDRFAGNRRAFKSLRNGICSPVPWSRDGLVIHHKPHSLVRCSGRSHSWQALRQISDRTRRADSKLDSFQASRAEQGCARARVRRAQFDIVQIQVSFTGRLGSFLCPMPPKTRTPPDNGS